MSDPGQLRSIQTILFLTKKKCQLHHDNCITFFAKRDFLIHPTVIFRNTYFKKAGFYPTDTYFAEDTLLWANGIINGCKFANIPKYLYYFRLNDNFFNRRNGIKHAISIFRLRIKITKMLNFGIKGYIYALLYCIIKLFPESILKVTYKLFR